ncbi:MAG: YggS family pyridoxal phosphate-dependent enzyme [Clostridia bacterium]|nr:YggS family pyridoxal phosphate-dependent enzyme [Clostridia bacterium]MBR5903442.1 YggS family pyridoxal phosphate-dependent enzyme [Clostridia bacterium]
MAVFTQEQMAQAIADIRGKIAQAAKVSLRQPRDITLCAVCKTRTSETVRLSAQLDVDIFGENHMQELVAHAQDGAYLGKDAHFIGHLQTNKVKKVVGTARMIQSVDSLRLLEAINSEARKQQITQDILFEINIGLEESKSGISPSALWELAEQAAAMDGIRVRGLMAIPPAGAEDSETRRYFEQMRKLFEKLQSSIYSNHSVDTLSMGMSGSYLAAIEEGATLVRVGTAIYGAREYKNI